MKANRPNIPPAFAPVILTLESQAEVDAIFTVINHVRLSAALGIADVSEETLIAFRDRDRSDTLHRAVNKLIP